jgi:hypothetical protein
VSVFFTPGDIFLKCYIEFADGINIFHCKSFTVVLSFAETESKLTNNNNNNNNNNNSCTEVTNARIK